MPLSGPCCLSPGSHGIAVGRFLIGAWREVATITAKHFFAIVQVNGGVGGEDAPWVEERRLNLQPRSPPHPFLQYTGRPGCTWRRDEVLGSPVPSNELGFAGPTLAKANPERTTRSTCLGGSTTASGYPIDMREILQRRLGPSHRFEVMNLGIGWYMSLHSAVNFIVHGVIAMKS